MGYHCFCRTKGGERSSAFKRGRRAPDVFLYMLFSPALLGKPASAAELASPPPADIVTTIGAEQSVAHKIAASSDAVDTMTIDSTRPQGMAPTPPVEPEGHHGRLTVYSTVLNAYLVPDLGVLAHDGPVIQTGATLNLPGGVWIDLWNSTPLPESGGWSLNNYGEEIDLTIGYSGTIIAVDMTASLAYFANQPLGSAGDDIIELSGRFSRTFSAGKLQISPYLRSQIWFGIDDFPHHAFLRAGASLAAPLGKRWSLATDISYVRNFRDARHLLRAEATLNYALRGNWTLSSSVKFSSRTRLVFGVGFSRTL